MVNNGHIEEVSFQDIFSKMKKALRFSLRRWWWLVIAGLAGGAIGARYAATKPETYTARLSFILEEGKTGGGLSALAGQFGFDLGGIGAGSGPLSADNVSLFLKSSTLTAETLLTPYDSAGNKSLADKYAEVNELKTQWKDDKNIAQEVSFPANSAAPFTRLQDSLLQVLIDRITKYDIGIGKPDRKASFIEVSTTMRDERLSQFYCERLVKSALNRYIEIKTNRQATNVNRLQRRADSIYALLNRKTYSAAAAQQQILDINPALQSTVTAPTEVIGRDKAMLTAIYGEIVKNLEISKVALNQETPVMQIIDDVRLPLKRNRTSRLVTSVAGAFVLVSLAFAFLIGSYLLLSPKKHSTQKVLAEA